MPGWAQVAVEPGVPWPESAWTITYEGRDLELTPGSTDTYPMVSLQLRQDELPELGIALISRFLSALSWIERRGARIVHRSAGGARITFGGHRRGGISGGFDPEHLPQRLSSQQRLALALYREAQSTEEEFYAFLSYFKIINMLHADGQSQMDWIRANVHRASDQGVRTRVMELQSAGTDVGEYLYVSCRCAVAHAATDPIADPDAPGDVERIRKDLFLIRSLAEVMIEHEFGVPSLGTIYRQHLYELDGFRAILGHALVERIKAGEDVPLAVFPTFPHININIRGQAADRTLADLNVEVVQCRNGVVGLQCARGDGACVVPLGLDLKSERLVFDPLRVRVLDDNTSGAPLLQAAVLRIWRDLLHNCAIEVRTADLGSRLGRTDGFLPMNMDVRGTVANIDGHLAALEAEAAHRDKTSAGPGPGAIVSALLALGRSLDPRDLFPAVVPEAAAFASTDPFAFLMASCLDRGAVSEVIWTVPFDLRCALGELSPVKLASMRVSDLDAVLRTLSRKPRHIHDAPRTIIELSQIIVNEFAGEAARVWQGRRAWEIRNTLQRIHGVGAGIAHMTVLLIERAFGVRFDDVDRPGMDIKGDVHTARVLFRLALSSAATPEDAVATARRIRPTCPGELDAPLWIVGRRWCRPTAPDCPACALGAICARVGVS